MLPNLIFLFNLLDVIPTNVQLYRRAVHRPSSELFMEQLYRGDMLYVPGVILLFSVRMLVIIVLYD